MGFVLGKRFSGGKLICRDFHKKFRASQFFVAGRRSVSVSLWKSTSLTLFLFSKLCSPLLPASRDEAAPEGYSTGKA